MSFIGDGDHKKLSVPGAVPQLLDESLAKAYWTELPDNLLLDIFSFLSPKEALNAGQVCRNWYRLSKDEMLWKSLLQETLFPDRTKKIKLKLPKSASSWLKEFQRIHYKTPFVESQILEEHTDEVLHVTFSHNGQLLASSSKDCSVILWRVSSCTCVSMAQKINFQERNWEYVQFCEFNASDTLLLVSGVNKLRRLSYTGEIFICEVQNFSVIAIVHGINNEPYDVFGAWLTERCYISGTFEFMEPENDGSSISELWANYVDESTENQRNLAQILNHNSSSVRTVLVAHPNANALPHTYASAAKKKDEDVCLIFTHGTVTYVPHQIVFKWLKLPKGSTKIFEQGKGISSEGYEPFTRKEHYIETNAHIIGMSLSPDHQYLYVNCRMWEQPAGNVVDDAAQFPPEISNDITLQVYSLSTYKLVDVHSGHKAFTANNGCFFIFLNVADQLVASGAEDHCAHVWDRHFGAKLATLKGHTNVVNCVAFNPVNQEMVVSASDDHTIRVWKSRHLSKLYEEADLEEQSGEVSPFYEDIFRETVL